MCGEMCAVQGQCHEAAVSAGERDASHCVGAYQRLSQGRRLSALLHGPIAGRGGRPERGLRAAEGKAAAGGAVRRGTQEAAAAVSPAYCHRDLSGGRGGARHDTHSAAQVSHCQGAAAAGTGAGHGGAGGDRRGDTLRQPTPAGGCVDHGTGRRFAGGSVGF